MAICKTLNLIHNKVGFINNQWLFFHFLSVKWQENDKHAMLHNPAFPGQKLTMCLKQPQSFQDSMTK